MKKGWKITFITVSCVLAVVLAVVMPLYFKLLKKAEIYDPDVQSGNIQNAKGEIAFGAGTDAITEPIRVKLSDYIADLDGRNVVSKNEEIATIEVVDGEIYVEVKGLGEVELEITAAGETEPTTEKFVVSNAVNVGTFAELKAAVEAKKAVALTADINMESGLDLYSDLYGNGHIVDCSAVPNGPYDTSFSIKGEKVTVRDANFTNFADKKGKGVKLTALNAKSGIIIACDGEKDFHPSLNLVNCVLENANRNLTVNAATVLVDSCIFRNSGDSNISVQTNNDGASDITIRNTILANSFVSCLTNWCMDVVESEAMFPRIKFEGYVDIYNWKPIETASIVPASEGFVSDIGNNTVQSALQSGNFDSELYDYNGEKYIHSAVLVICTKPGGSNVPVIDGLEAAGYARRHIPIDKTVAKIICTCDIVGFDGKTAPSILPDSKMEDSEHFKNR